MYNWFLDCFPRPVSTRYHHLATMESYSEMITLKLGSVSEVGSNQLWTTKGKRTHCCPRDHLNQASMESFNDFGPLPFQALFSQREYAHMVRSTVPGTIVQETKRPTKIDWIPLKMIKIFKTVWSAIHSHVSSGKDDKPHPCCVSPKAADQQGPLKKTQDHVLHLCNTLDSHRFLFRFFFFFFFIALVSFSEVPACTSESNYPGMCHPILLRKQSLDNPRYWESMAKHW